MLQKKEMDSEVSGNLPKPQPTKQDDVNSVPWHQSPRQFTYLPCIPSQRRRNPSAGRLTVSHSPSPGNNPYTCKVLLWNVDHSSSIYKIISQCFYWLCVFCTQKGSGKERSQKIPYSMEHEETLILMRVERLVSFHWCSRRCGFISHFLFIFFWDRDLALLPKLGWNS